MTEAEKSVAERFGLNLKLCRRHAELTQGELAERSSLTRQAIILIELGDRRPHLESFVSLLAALDIEPPLLLDGIRWIPARRRAPTGVKGDPPAPARPSPGPRAGPRARL
jgi:transcriptional regulator with XRE-family HTH domain